MGANVAINNAVSAMKNVQEELSVASNNMANAQTSGFKEAFLVTTDNVYTNYNTTGANSNSPTHLQLGSGSRGQAIVERMTPGAMKTTNNIWDMAIVGSNGMLMFQIRFANGSLGYTRSGRFKLDSQRRLITQDGHFVTSADGAEISIPEGVSCDENHIRVKDNGVIEYKDEDGSWEEVDNGKLGVFSFANPSGMNKISGGVMLATDVSGEPLEMDMGNTTGYGQIQNKMYEGSNVDVINTVSELVQKQVQSKIAAELLKTASEAEKDSIGALRG